MNITNAQAVRFTDKARTLANRLGSLRRTLDQFLIDIVSDFEALTGENVNGDFIEDNFLATRPITKENMAQLKFVGEQVLTALTADDREAIVSRIATDTQPQF